MKWNLFKVRYKWKNKNEMSIQQDCTLLAQDATECRLMIEARHGKNNCEILYCQQLSNRIDAFSPNFLKSFTCPACRKKTEKKKEKIVDKMFKNSIGKNFWSTATWGGK